MSSATATTVAVPGRRAMPEQLVAARREALAARPATLSATGLSAELLGDLASKLLLRSGVLSLSVLADRLAIAGAILIDVLALLRREARIEVRPGGGGTESELCYTLTERGRQLAVHALHRDGYVGPAPVGLEDYARLVAAQSVHGRRINSGIMQRALQGAVVTDELRDRLGAAMHSGRAIFLYGPAGTGKTFVAGKLQRALPSEMLMPHALLVNGAIVRLFDPTLHKRVELLDAASPLLLSAGFDRRYVCCERPAIHVGGELELSMLDVERVSATRELLAPLQLKANNGMLIIDDLGRQRCTAEQILNRWIVPMEERVNHFSIGGGAYFSVPFDLVLIFSTNLNPEMLADDALQRRLGYKIAFGPVAPDLYMQVWKQTCAALQLPFEPGLVEFAIEQLHRRHGIELMPVHPRDLLNMVVNRLRYEERELTLDRELLIWAWNSNFLHSR